MNTRIATPMLTQTPRDSYTQFPIEGMRLLDGPDPAAEAAAAAAATAAAKVISDKAVADAAAAEATRVADAAAAEAARIAASGLSESEAKLLKDSMAHKKLAADTKAALDAANARLLDFDGLDATEIKALVAAQKVAKKAAKDAEDAALVKAGEWDRLKTSMAATHAAELEAAKSAGASSQTALTAALATIDDLTVGSSFNTSTYVGEELVLTPSIARTVFGANFDLVNGTVVGHDKPRGAKDRTPLVDSSGNALSFDDAMKKLVASSPEKDRLIRSSIQPGARSATTTTGRTTVPAKGGELRGMARIAAGLAAHGAPVGPK